MATTIALAAVRIDTGSRKNRDIWRSARFGLRTCGISSAERNEYFPNVPTFKEQGYDVAAAIWRGVMVKAGTPQPIVDKLVAALDTMKKTEDWKKFSQLNMQSSVDVSLAQMQAQVRQEVRDDAEFLKATGLRK